MVERYYNQPDEDKLKDARPEIYYQLGVTPEGTEVPRDHRDIINKLDGCHMAHVPVGADPKWRFHWRIGEQPKETKWPLLNADPVIPEGFEDEWEEKMNNWGTYMVETCTTCAQMAAVGFGLEYTAFSDKMKNAPHLLAPTGSDLGKFGEKDTIFAGFHRDLNFLTCHGKSRFPGLLAWTREKKRFPVVVPDGCLLLQAGIQLEYLTGGHVQAGYHEVVFTDLTQEKLEKAKENGDILWRVSSTCFSHIASDEILEPLEGFKSLISEEQAAEYPAIETGAQVQMELDAIALGEKEKELKGE
eukprot:TRINITY_DN2240_c0_g1_i1.p2 TRINITY_DN2240_c0_g1~~TRINITY_DN2240_c0_g1_i1.p2  ORF type:complete len:301 (-),score=107.88 TRINITY_DN2240_c0_g1_i1:169-1071(-)